VEQPSPMGFSEGKRRPLRPVTPATETPQPGTAPPSEETEIPDLEPQGLKARAQRLRETAFGPRRPLGSPEGRAQALPNPRSKSRDSSDERRFVDALAVGIRSVTKWIDWALGERTGKDFVATAEECLAIAGPAAGAILDRIPETGPLADLEDRAGEIGAGIAAVTYLGRVAFGRPGGRAEAEELHEAVVRRMSGAKKRVKQEVDDMAAGEQKSEPDPQARSRIYGLDDDWGTESVGPV